MTCASCGAAVPITQKFCGECGTPVRAEVALRPDDPLRAELALALGATYELGRLLGRGGMGAVYLARERALDRMVAVKVLPPDIAGSEESRERFRREARTAARLTHQNIVPLYTFGETAGLVFYVMGYVRGESLADRMRTRGALPADDVRRILADLASALDYAHKQGVIHRDVKPDNILIDEESGRPLLADFGIAKASSSGATLTVDGAILGTPLYMSPEQASGDRALDGRSDLYALGVLGYTMLRGLPPFDGSTAHEIIAQHLTREPPPLDQAIAPDDVAICIRRCLEKDPARRWSSAAELREALGVGSAAEIELPEELADYRGAGFVAAIMTGGLWLASWYIHLFPEPAKAGHPPLLSWFFLGISVLAPITVPFMHRRVMKSGFSRDAAWRLLFHLPDWMTQFGPWPRVIRRPGDVWDRLPRPIRFARALLSGLFICLALGAPALILYRNSDRWNPEPTWIAAERRYAAGWSPLRLALTINVPAAVLTLFLGAVSIAVGFRKRWKLSPDEAAKLIAMPTRGRAFWRKPEIAAMLLPAPAVSQQLAREPRSAREYEQALRDLARQLPSAQQMLGAEAFTAARQAVEAIGGLDEHIAALEGDVDTSELARLEQRLATSGTAGSRKAGDAQAMRTLLSSQLELLRRMQTRVEEAKTRRERLHEGLRTLWLHVADLRAAAASDDSSMTGITGKLRALCEEMQRQADAADSVAVLVAPARTPGASISG